MTFPGMGHDLPPQLWSRMVDEISALIRHVRDGWSGSRAST